MIWVGSCTMEDVLMPLGQFIMKGVDIPPSCVQRLNSLNGELLALAQGRS